MKFNKNSKIVIIGAGPSGIHMAYELTKIGYTNIKILEKENEVGGQSKSVKIGRDYHDLSTFNLLTQFEYVKEFARDVGVETFFVKNKQVQCINELGNKVSMLDYTLDEYYKITKSRSKIGLYFRYKSEINKLLKFKELYTDNDGFPLLEYKDILARSFLQFCQDNNFVILAILMKIKTKSWGAHYIEKLTMFEVVTGGKVNMGLITDSPIIKTGFNSLWTKAVQKFNLQVKLSAKVTKIEMCDASNNKKAAKNFVRLSYSNPNNSIITEEFDLCFVACHFPIKILKNPTFEQKQIFKHFNLRSTCHTISTVYTGISQNNSPLAPITFSLQESKVKFPINIVINRPAILSNNGCLTKVASQFYVGNSKFGAVKNKKFYEEAEEDLKQDLLDNFSEVVLSIHTKSYFHNWGNWITEEDVKKEYPWKILNIQGDNNMFFIGEHYFASGVPKTFIYNKLLLKRHGFYNQ